MGDSSDAASKQATRLLARGQGWHSFEVLCSAGPRDRPFEEQHSQFTVAAVMSGTFTYRSTQGQVLLTPGSLLLGNAGACFTCGHEHAAGDRCIAFRFDGQLLEEIASEVPGATRASFACLRVPPVSDLLPLLDRIAGSMEDHAALEELSLCVAARAVQFCARPQRQHRASRESRTWQRSAEAVRFLEQNFMQDISLETLAAASGVSRYHFLRTFKLAVGVTPHQYVLRTRLRAAASELREKPARVLDIALGCGFNDLSEFTRRFSRTFGMAPAGYGRAWRSRRAGSNFPQDPRRV
jgi:AraC family transcriptional regulator